MRDLPFLDGHLPRAFRRRVVVVTPDRQRAYHPDEWRGTLVVVERGCLDLHCPRGGIRSFPAGAVLHLQDIALRELRTPGPEPCVLIAVHRRRTVSYRIVDLPDRPFLGARVTCTLTAMAVIADRLPEIIGRVLAAGAPVAGAPFLRYLVLGADGRVDVQAGVPVDDPGPLAGGGFTADALPAGRYAVTRYAGHLDGLAAATDTLLAAVTADGVAFDRADRPDGEHWACRAEHFLSLPGEQPETELAFRLADQAP